MFDDVPISLIGYDINKLERVKGWNGFISPDGTFYKVIERGSLETSHDNFVEAFCSIKLNIDLKKLYEKIKENNKDIKGNLSYKDLFIQLLGFINYESFSSYLCIGLPEKEYNNRKITRQQIETIIKLIEINKDSIKNLNQILLDDRKHNAYELRQCLEGDSKHNVYQYTHLYRDWNVYESRFKLKKRY